MLKKIAYFIGIITLAPVIAFILLTTLFAADARFNSVLHYALSVFYLTVLPLLAYPLQHVIPGFKGKGRDAQRKLAFIFSVAGYAAGILTAIFASAPSVYLTVYLSYFASGALLMFVNKVLKIKASGHACGASGPIVLAAYFFGGYGWLLALALPIIFWARIKMGRHKPGELFFGAACSILCTFISIFAVMGF